MKNTIRLALVIGLVVLLLLIAGFVTAAIFHVLLDILYISLIILAAFTLLSTLFLLYAVFSLIRAITTVRDEMKPLLSSVQETVGIVKDTAKSAGQTASTIGSTAQLAREFALRPSVRATAAVVAGQQVLRIFTGRGHAGSRVDQRRKQQMEAITGGE